MKKTIVAIIVLLLGVAASAQSAADSLARVSPEAIDTTLVGRSIFSLLPSKEKGDKAEVTVEQSSAVMEAMKKHIAANAARKQSGYRVRIYFDNSRNSRVASEQADSKFVEMHPGIPAYRSYQNPFFKVTVGDFRTKSEAMELLEGVKAEFPSSFIVREEINYPVVTVE